MSYQAVFEENKVQAAIQMYSENPNLTIAHCIRECRATLTRVYRRLKGTPASNTRGGHNKKLIEPQEHAIRDHLLFLYYIGRNTSKSYVLTCANRLLAFEGRVNQKTRDIVTVNVR